MATHQTVVDRHSNVVKIWDDGEHRRVVKTYVSRPRTLKSVVYSVLSALGRDVPVEYLSPTQRRDFERQTLTLWRDHGFRAPAEASVPDELSSDDVVLAEEALNGSTLANLLEDADVNIEQKWQEIDAVLHEMRDRHAIALYTGQHQLIHYDSNTRNIILTDQGPTRVDFEMGHLQERIDRSAVREVQKLLLQIANSIGKEHVPTLVDRAFSEYRIRHILRRMADSTLDRPFAAHHLRRDDRRKRRSPGLVTKFDLAWTVREYLTPQQGDQSKKSSAFTKAEAGSWDGKFYQSLDDSDPRGRDMVHRYEVMQFPESFAGKSVLDIGCNLGRICIDAAARGSDRSVGIDYRDDVMTAVNDHCQSNKIPAAFYPFDINDGVETLQSQIGPEPFDYVFVLSIWSHVDQQKLWDTINAMCKGVCYFEDNAPSRVKSLEKLERILRDNLDFSSIEFLGFTTDRGVRAVYRLSK